MASTSSKAPGLLYLSIHLAIIVQPRFCSFARPCPPSFPFSSHLSLMARAQKAEVNRQLGLFSPLPVRQQLSRPSCCRAAQQQGTLEPKLAILRGSRGEGTHREERNGWRAFSLSLSLSLPGACPRSLPFCHDMTGRITDTDSVL